MHRQVAAGRRFEIFLDSDHILRSIYAVVKYLKIF